MSSIETGIIIGIIGGSLVVFCFLIAYIYNTLQYYYRIQKTYTRLISADGGYGYYDTKKESSGKGVQVHTFNKPSSDNDGVGNEDEDLVEGIIQLPSLTGNLVKEYDHTVAITENYRFQDTLLGKGSSAHVVLGVNKKTQRRYAIKVVDITKRNAAWRFDREFDILKECDHINITRIFEMYRKKNALYFVMELHTGGHLGQAVLNHRGPLPQEKARAYILQLTQAIAHCHHRGICHRDIKLQNIVLENKGAEAQIKLLDFGNATRFVGNTPMNKLVGTTYTCAPEVFKQEYDERCDVWSIGVVSYILLSGRRPFEALHIQNNPKAKESGVIANILLGRYHFLEESWEEISGNAIHFIKSCLELNYKHRCNSDGLLQHPWLNALIEGDEFSEDMVNGRFSGLLNGTGAIKLQRRLTNSSHSADIRRTAMIGVAFMMPTGKVSHLRRIFQRIDRRGRGYVTKYDFYEAMSELNPTLSELESNHIFHAMDQDSNNQISFTEFVAATIDPREVDITELNQAYRLLDTDQKGYITYDDLKRVLWTWMEEDIENEPMRQEVDHNHNFMSDADFDRLLDEVMNRNKEIRKHRFEALQNRIHKSIQQADTNGDGVISYTEFLFAMADIGDQSTPLESFKQTRTRQGHSNSMYSTERNIMQVPDQENANPRRNLTGNEIMTGSLPSTAEENKEGSSMENSMSNEAKPPSLSRGNSWNSRRKTESSLKLSNKAFSLRKSSILFTRRVSRAVNSFWGSNASRSSSSSSSNNIINKTPGHVDVAKAINEANLEDKVNGDIADNNYTIPESRERRGSKRKERNSGLTGIVQNTPTKLSHRRAVPTIIQLMSEDVMNGFNKIGTLLLGGTDKNDQELDQMKKFHSSKDVKVTPILDDEIYSDDSFDDDDHEDMEMFQSRRLSSPALLWQSIKRRSSSIFGGRSGSIVSVVNNESIGKTATVRSKETRELLDSSMRWNEKRKVPVKVATAMDISTEYTDENTAPSRKSTLSQNNSSTSGHTNMSGDKGKGEDNIKGMDSNNGIISVSALASYQPDLNSEVNVNANSYVSNTMSSLDEDVQGMVAGIMRQLSKVKGGSDSPNHDEMNTYTSPSSSPVLHSNKARSRTSSFASSSSGGSDENNDHSGPILLPSQIVHSGNSNEDHLEDNEEDGDEFDTGEHQDGLNPLTNVIDDVDVEQTNFLTTTMEDMDNYNASTIPLYLLSELKISEMSKDANSTNVDPSSQEIDGLPGVSNTAQTAAEQGSQEIHNRKSFTPNNVQINGNGMVAEEDNRTYHNESSDGSQQNIDKKRCIEAGELDQEVTGNSLSSILANSNCSPMNGKIKRDSFNSKKSYDFLDSPSHSYLNEYTNDSTLSDGSGDKLTELVSYLKTNPDNLSDLTPEHVQELSDRIIDPTVRMPTIKEGLRKSSTDSTPTALLQTIHSAFNAGVKLGQSLGTGSPTVGNNDEQHNDTESNNADESNGQSADAMERGVLRTRRMSIS